MNDLGLTAWLAVGAILTAWGLLTAAMNRRPLGAATGAVLILAGAALQLAALVRYAVLDAAALSVLPAGLVLGGVLILVVRAMSSPGDTS